MKDKRTDCKSAFANRLEKLMTTFNYNQAFVADKVECSRSIVSKWLHQLREPTLVNIWKLADLFECSVDVLVGRKPLGE